MVLKRLDHKYALFEIIDDIPISDSNFLDILKNKLMNYQNIGRELKYKMTIPSFYEESNQVDI